MNESNLAIHELVAKVTDSQKWMVAVWVVEEGKIKMVNRITHQFPSDDFLAAIGQLANNCYEEKLKCDKAEKPVKQELPSDPLPPVKIFKMPSLGVPKSLLISPEESKVPELPTTPPPNGGPFDNVFIDTGEESSPEVPKNENGKTE